MGSVAHTNEPGDIRVLCQISVSQTAPLHFHKDSIEALLVIHGKILYISNDQVDVLTEGSFALVWQSDVHCYSPYQSEQFDSYNTNLRDYEFNKVINLFNGGSRITGLLSHASSLITRLEEPGFFNMRSKFEEIMNLVEQ